MSSARIGVVLAGGRASRMGGDKAGAVLAGQTLLARAVATVTAAGLLPRVCARADTALPATEGLEPGAVWREPSFGPQAHAAHPLAGVAYALQQAREPIVVLPVDLPLLPALVLEALAMHPGPLAVIATGERPAALVARIDPALADGAQEAASAGAPALRTLKNLGADLLDLATLLPDRQVGRALTNVNAPGDLATVAGLLDQGAS